MSVPYSNIPWNQERCDGVALPVNFTSQVADSDEVVNAYLVGTYNNNPDMLRLLLYKLSNAGPPWRPRFDDNDVFAGLECGSCGIDYNDCNMQGDPLHYGDCAWRTAYNLEGNTDLVPIEERVQRGVV